MRRGILIFLLLLAAALLFAVHMVWTLLSLLVVDGSADAIPKSDLPAAGSELIGSRTKLIPKFIHQTYKNTSIPLVWQEAQQSCIDLHPTSDGWTYKLWTDDIMDGFIAKEYPWFLDTFRGYPFPIQRADAIRYFVLSHYGGVYIDLDDGCNRPLDALLSYPAFVRKTVPTGISNDVMGAVPRHPFFMRVVDELKNYNRGWVLPYITVMASTGPLFLSIIWRHYSSEGSNVGDGIDGGRIRIIFPEEYQNYPWSFFTHHVGDSWHDADSDFIFWMSHNWVFVTLVGFVIGGSVILAAWWVYRRFVLKVKPKSQSELSSWKIASIKSRIPFWRRKSVRKEYELVSRHEV